MRLFLLSAAILVSCETPGKPTPPDEADADTDIDTDADGDTDSDTDVDTPVCAPAVDICEGACVLDVAVDFATVTGHVTFDGADVTVPDWQILFVETTSGRAHTGGADGESDADYRVNVPPGTYDVLAHGWSDTAFQGTWLVASGLPLADDQELDVNLDPHVVSGRATYGGASLAADGWRVKLTDTATGREYSGGPYDAADPAAYRVHAPAGTYDVVAHAYGGGDRPFQGVWPVATDVTIEADHTLDVALVPVTVTGVADLAAAELASEGWAVVFTDTTTGWAYEGGAADEPGTYRVELPAGTYDVTATGSPSFGVTASYPVVSDLPVTGDRTFDLELVVHDVTGRIAYDGADLTRDLWYLVFTDTTTGFTYRAEPFDPDDLARFHGVVPPGTYDVVAYGWEGGEFEGTWPVVRGLAVRADRELDVDLVSHHVGGHATYGFAPVASSAWQVVFTETSSGLTYTGGPFDDVEQDLYRASVPPGTYDVTAQGWDEAGFVGTWHVANEVTVADVTVLDVTLTPYEVTGHATVDGLDLSDPDWLVRFTDLTTGATFDAAPEPATPADYRLDLPWGAYDVAAHGGDPDSFLGWWPVGTCVEVGP